MAGKNFLFQSYLSTISILGGLLIVYSLTLVPSFAPPFHFLLFVILAAIAPFITSSFSITEKTSITYQVSPAVSMAVIILFGPFAAVLIEATSAISLWLFKRQEKNKWRKSITQLGFNIGMAGISILIAGFTYAGVVGSNQDNLFILGLAILIASIVADQTNIWILAGIIWLQSGRTVSPLSIWYDNIWAMSLSIPLMGIGGGLLAYSLVAFGPLGVIVFFLPIMLSAIAFRLYLNKMRVHMDNLEQLIQARTQELEDLNKRKEAFIAILTHDMITPLTSMQLYTELIHDDPTTPEKDPELIEAMLRCQHSLQRLFRNILDLDKLKSGEGIQIKKSHFNMSNLIDSVKEIVISEANQKNIDLKIEYDSQKMMIFADKNQIERVLINLFSNAIKYTPALGSIHIIASQDHQNTTIQVKDSGYGIPEEELPFIFERYKRVEKLQDKATGTGLGLAITQALTQAHGGEISVSSKINVGTTFTVRLPNHESQSKRKLEKTSEQFAQFLV